MKKILALCFLFLGMLVYSQKEQFKMQFNYISVYRDGKWEKPIGGKNTFVFNVGDGADVICYTASGKKEKYTKISSVKEGKTEDGDAYQVMGILDEEGNEIVLFLYKIGVLKLVFSENFQIQYNQ